MLFHITQTHTPEECPTDVGGTKALYDAKVEGIKLRAAYGAFSEHTLYYVVEAESLDAIHKFLGPGWKRCTSVVTPVAEEPIVG